MNRSTPLLFASCLLYLLPLWSQVTPEELAHAVQTQECARIAEALDVTVFSGEQMTFQGGVCYYRNGNFARARELFEEVFRAKGSMEPHALFWLAKIEATGGNQEKAMQYLRAIPAGILNTSMLTQPVFETMAMENAEFQALLRANRAGFNFWTTILALIAVIGLLTGMFLLVGKSRFSEGEKWLAAVVLAFALIMISYVTIWTGYARTFPYLRNAWPFLTLTVGPSLYFYLRATFRDPYPKNERYRHYVIPGISMLLSLPAILILKWIGPGVTRDMLAMASAPVLLTGHLLYYAVMMTELARNEWQVDTNIRLWTSIVTRGMWVYTLAFFSYFILAACSFFSPEWDYTISLVMSIGVLGITYMGFIQRKVFSSVPVESFLPVQKYKSSGLTQGASASIKIKLERLLTEDQVFKENELRLDDLAAYLDINRHQLSQVINEHYKVNFFELINKYRIEYVRRVLEQPDSDRYTIIQIAYEAGFNNKASFNRYFKQETGMTPSAYRMKYLGERA